MFPRSNSFTSGQVRQGPPQTTEAVQSEAPEHVAEAPVAVAVSPVDAQIEALFAAVKSHPEGVDDFDVAQKCHMLIADMTQMPAPLQLRSLDQLIARTAMFVDPENSDVAPQTRQLMGSIFREEIRPAVAGLHFQMNAGPVDHSRLKDNLLGDIDELLRQVPLAYDPQHAIHVVAYASAVDARKREVAEIALNERSSGDHGGIADNLVGAHARMREIADVYLAQGYDSPAAKLVIAIRKYKDAGTSEDKFRIYERLVRPAISTGATVEDRDYWLRSADAACARDGSNDEGLQIRMLENKAIDRVIDELTALFVK